MSLCPVAITGMGIVCAIGLDAQQVACSLRGKSSGIRKMKYLSSIHSDLPVGEVQLDDAQMKRMLGISTPDPVSRTGMMGAIALKQALQQAGITSFKGRRVTVVNGTTVGSLDVTERFFEQMKSDDSLLRLPFSNECGKSTEEMLRMAGIEGADSCTISTACSSSLNSIIIGTELLRSGQTDIVIAGGSEGLSKFHLNGFNTLMILDKERCRPFDSTRAGLNLGEGAAYVVLERDSSDRALAYIGGYGNRCDAFHQTASSPEGEGAFLAMSDALQMSGLRPCDISYVNAHGTGTPNNDLSEGAALRRVFGGTMPPVSSTKAFTGHTTSASGSIGTVICVLAMREGFIPANLGWQHPIEDDIVPTMGAEGVFPSNVMCNAFGFGGNDSSLVLRRDIPSTLCSDTEIEGVECSVAAEVEVSGTEQLAQLKEFVAPIALRRMDTLSKAAMLSSLKALAKSGIKTPDAVIGATSRGMLSISQQFLDDINSLGEQTLKPTLFMQSTHNTIASALAIHTGCHGYNITYSHGDKSLQWALWDARRLILSGKASSVLVTCFDEATAVFSSFMQRSGKAAPAPVAAKTIVLVRK